MKDCGDCYLNIMDECDSNVPTVCDRYCTCMVDSFGRIIWCPMHEAAPELLKELKRLRAWLKIQGFVATPALDAVVDKAEGK